MLDNPLLRYPLKDTWCHDTETDQWLRKANFPGKGEVNLASFTIGNIACVGMSEPFAYDSYLGKSLDHHFYKYDPNADTWTEVSNLVRAFLKLSRGQPRTKQLQAQAAMKIGPFTGRYMFLLLNILLIETETQLTS